MREDRRVYLCLHTCTCVCVCVCLCVWQSHAGETILWRTQVIDNTLKNSRNSSINMLQTEREAPEFSSSKNEK